MSNNRRKLADLTIRDNFMFANVMTDEANCRAFLKMALGISPRAVTASYEKSITFSPDYRGVRLDVIAIGADGTRCNIEVQVQNRHIAKRSRYYHSQMDMEMIATGDPYEGLPDSYVIFVCDFDPVGAGKYRYTFEQTCKELPEYPLGSGVHTVFLSTAGKNDGEEPEGLVKFLKFVGASLEESMKDFGDAYVSQLQESISKIKKDHDVEAHFMLLEEMLKDKQEIGRSEGMEIGRSEGMEIGRSEGMNIGCSLIRNELLQVLSSLGEVPEDVRGRIESEDDAATLSRMIVLAARANSIDGFTEGLDGIY